MFKRQAHSGVLFNLTDNFVQLARLVRMDERPLVVDSFAEYPPSDGDGISNWLNTNFVARGSHGYLPGYCGFHPVDRLLVRETFIPRRLAEPDYLSGLVAKYNNVVPANDWQTAALHPIEGLAMAADGLSQQGLLFGVPLAAIREQQQSLLKFGIWPRRLEVGTLVLLGSLSRHVAQTPLGRAVVICEIEPSQTRVYVVAKDGVHTFSPLPHGLLSIDEAAMKEFNAPDLATARRHLESPTDGLRNNGRHLVRVISRQLQLTLDSFEMKTGHSIGHLYCAQLPASLDWLARTMGAAVGLENLESWLTSDGLQIVTDGTPLGPGWLSTLSLVSHSAPLLHDQDQKT